jgi:glycosyltransferase involved in cell wall biosynthesis
MHRGIERAIGQKVNKWSLLYYGTDCNFFSRQFRTKSNNQFVFLQISSFAEKKGQEYSISAFSKFIKKNNNINCKLILAGEGDLKAEAEKRVKDLDLMSHVDFPGLVNKSEAKKLMESADCFVHHSITSSTRGDMEGIPNAIMEAMAMELPIISTFHAGIPELVEDGVNGLLVNERDVDAYAEAMNKILTWDYLPQNRAKIEAYFEKEKHGKLLVQYYEDAIHEMKKQDI